MTFKERKKARKEYYFKYEYKWKDCVCTACNGSGKYDHNGSPECGACDGTGKGKISPLNTWVEKNNMYGKVGVWRSGNILSVATAFAKNALAITNVVVIADIDNDKIDADATVVGYQEFNDHYILRLMESDTMEMFSLYLLKL